MKRRIIIFIFLLLTIALDAQNVTITGRSNKTNTLIRLFVYEDLVNDYGVLLDQVKTDQQGHFILEGQVKHVISARVYVGLEYVDLILTPNATYDIEIIVPEQQDNVSYFEKELPTIRVKHATDKGVYRQMVLAEEIINTYLIEHFNQIYRGRQLRYLDSIQNTINRELPDLKSDYVKNHIRYKLAAIRLAISTDGGKKVVSEFYDSQPVLYTQSAYIDLFKELFDGYFNSASYDSHLLNDAFAQGPGPFKKYLDSAPFMAKNPRLAELITIFNLQKLCYSDRHTSQIAKEHLNYIKAQTKYDEHKTIITDFSAKLNRLAPGAPATDFTLKDGEGKNVSLSDYKDGLVLLQFVDGMSPISERQFSELRDLHRQWQDTVQILTIAIHDKMPLFKRQFEEKRIDWPLLDLGDQILLLETYNVRTFPEYILIRKGTKIGEAPAPSPERYLEERVRRLYGK
ncbi:MAG: redoxin domain-containing protein [Bacteroidales bacterium]|nr:redoxin domain-containing protein [Bacteroidales bacterium]